MSITVLDERLRAIWRDGPASGAFAVRQLERDERFAIDGDVVLPTASVFKVPVLVEAFRQMGGGAFALDDRWEMDEDDKSTGSGVLVRLDAGLRPTVRDLLTLMTIISDNTATDMLVRRLGPARITATMRELGLARTTVAAGCRDLLRPMLGEAQPALAPWQMARHVQAHPIDPECVAYGDTDATNVTTAREMTDLFARLHTGAGMDAIGVDAAARAAMVEILLLQQLNERLPRFLPPGTRVAHKTGSLSGPWAIRNDAGLIDLGAGGTAAIAVLTRTRVPEGRTPRELGRFLTAIDEQIGELALAVYEHYAG